MSLSETPEHALALAGTSSSFDITRRLKAAGIHFGLSLLLAGLCAALVFGLWFPWPYRIVSGGKELFLLIVSVDVVLGPLLTFAVFNLKKPKKELMRDLAVIVALQLAALCYGLYTVYLARPVALAFEVDRLRVVTHVEVKQDELAKAREGFQSLPLSGPRLTGTRESSSGDERFKSIEMGLQGVDISMRPSYWVPYVESKDRALKRARDIAALRKQYPQQIALIDAAIAKAGKPEGALKFLPLQAREMGWSALIDASTAEPLTYLPLEGFF